jgi:hypothetical protein
MPTYMLDGTDKVRFPQRPLTLTLRVEGGHSVVARLAAQRDGQELTPAVQRPDLMVLSRIEGQIVVSVVPVQSDYFPLGTLVNLAVVVEDRASFDPERAVLVPVDVSGLGGRDLITIDNNEGALELKVVQSSTYENLSPLANSARGVTRELLEVHLAGRQPAFNVLLAVDGSSSAVPLQEDGTFRALVEVITGVVQVVGHGGKICSAIVDETSRLLPECDLATLPAALMDALGERIPSTGFRIASGTAEMEARAQDTEQLLYVLTDAMPAEIEDLANWQYSSGTRRHVVAATSPAAWQLLYGETRHTVIEPGSAKESLESRLLADRRALQELVKSLLQACFEENSLNSGKVGA